MFLCNISPCLLFFMLNKFWSLYMLNNIYIYFIHKLQVLQHILGSINYYNYIINRQCFFHHLIGLVIYLFIKVVKYKNKNKFDKFKGPISNMILSSNKQQIHYHHHQGILIACGNSIVYFQDQYICNCFCMMLLRCQH